MKKLMFMAVISGLLLSSTAAFAGKITLTVDFGGSKVKFRQIDTETTAVCAFKRMVANRLNLDVKKFNLRRSGTIMDQDKMLSDLRLHAGSFIKVQEVGYSSQCR